MFFQHRWPNVCGAEETNSDTINNGKGGGGRGEVARGFQALNLMLEIIIHWMVTWLEMFTTILTRQRKNRRSDLCSRHREASSSMQKVEKEIRKTRNWSVKSACRRACRVPCWSDIWEPSLTALCSLERLVSGLMSDQKSAGSELR